jgi:alpha-mannosidase
MRSTLLSFLLAVALFSQTAYVVPHTHWEGAVFKTRAEYLEMGLPHIEQALRLFKIHPEYRFVLDQACYVKPFLERYPQEEALFRRFLAEGRLQIAGGTDSMHDNNMPSGESIVRQLLVGKTYFRDKLGYEVTSGWGLDTFGHNAQMPQILKLAGMKSYWMQRGVASETSPSEFLWEGLDGTRLPAYWLPTSYAAFYGSPRSFELFRSFALGRYGALAPNTRSPDRVLLDGADVTEPEEHLPGMIEQFNRWGARPFTLRLATAAEFEAVVARRGGLSVVRGELNPLFQGVYSSRIEVKQANRELERLLGEAEKISVLAGASEWGRLAAAWEPVLFNQAHDLASGVMVDKVYEDSMRGFAVARHRGGEILESNLTSLAVRIDTSGEGLPVAVFNLLGWPRTDVVEVEIGVSEAGVRELELRDPSGAVVPMQMLSSRRGEDGGLTGARLLFVARDVPAMGYSVYRVLPARAPAPSARNQDSSSIENEFFRAGFVRETGAMTSLVLKQDGWETLRAPGNVVIREHDGGDFWQLYGTLGGGMTQERGETRAPDAARGEWSNLQVGGGSLRRGVVMSEYRVAHPFGKNHFSTRVRIYAGVRRIDIHTEIFNTEELVRYRVMFPTSVRNGRNVQEIPFGAVERPPRREYPAQNWFDFGDGVHGLALLNRGLPGSNVFDGTMLLSLARSARILAYGFGGGYEPGVSSDTGLELNRRLVSDYALVPHAGGWSAAGVHRAGWEFNTPLTARVLAAHPGTLPKRWGWVEVNHPGVVVSALKPGRDGGAIVRVYEATGRATGPVRARLGAAVASVEEVNLLEDRIRSARLDGRAFTFELRPFEIRSFRIR